VLLYIIRQRIVVFFCSACEDRKDRGYLWPSLLASCGSVDPSLAPKRRRTHRVLGPVVAQLLFRIFQAATNSGQSRHRTHIQRPHCSRLALGIRRHRRRHYSDFLPIRVIPLVFNCKQRRFSVYLPLLVFVRTFSFDFLLFPSPS
jgi:hypothetical protein